MIKVFNNSSDSPKVVVESKFLINNSTVSTADYIENFKGSDLMFVKLTFSGLPSGNMISKAALNLYCENVFSKTFAKVVHYGNVAFTDSNIKALAQSFNSNSDVIEKVFICGAEPSSASPGGEKAFSLDITKATRNIGYNTPIVLAIGFPNHENQSLKVHSAQALAVNNKVCISMLTDVRGLNSIYKYDEFDLGNAGKMNVNLFTGNLIYSLPLVSTVSRKNPITLTLFQNPETSNTVQPINQKFVPNYLYYIYLMDDSYVIEDPTGFKKYYDKVDVSDATILKNKYGIKHKTSNSGILYQSTFDYSYFYITESNGVKTIKLYDKEDTLMLFEVTSTVTKLKEITTALGYKTTYTWSDSKLISIVNNDGETMELSYSGDKINLISFPSIKQYVSISFNSLSSEITFRHYHKEIQDDLSVVEETLKSITLVVAVDEIIDVIDNITGLHLYKFYNEILIENSDGYTLADTCYEFDNYYTKATDVEGKSLYYHFDNYGRVKTIFDDYARTITYNYDELENGESRNLTGVSKVQTNSRNLLENHSFENSELFATSETGWYKNVTTMAKVSVDTGGALTDKCLRIDSVSTDTVTVIQDIVKPISGSYALSGFIKHPVTTGLNSTNVVVKALGTYKVDEEVTTQVDSSTTTTEIVTVTKAFEAKANLDFTKSDWYHFKTNKITIPSAAKNITMSVNISISNIETTLFVDDLQLTDAKFITRHNLIENGYMEFHKSTGRPYGWKFENFETEDKVTTIVSSDVHSKILGEKVMRIAPGDCGISGDSYTLKKMYKSMNFNGSAGEQLIFSVLGKADVTNNVIFRSFITMTYETKGDITYRFDFDKNFSNWQMLTRTIATEDNYTKVVVGIEYDGGVEALFDCFQLYRDSFGKYYNYDSRGNLIETIDSEGMSTKVTYDTDNKIREISTNDGSCFRYTYKNGLLEKVKDLNGTTIEFAYDSDNRVKTQTIKYGTETITTSKTYDDVNNTETTIDEFGKSSIVALDYLKRMSSQISPLSQETEYTYNSKLKLSKIQTKLGSVVHKNEFIYDEKGNATKLVSYGGNTYTIIYDSFDRISSIKCDNKIIESYEYDPLVNGFSKGNLIKKTIGENGDYYQFEYNDEGEITKYKLNGITLATYAYDDTGNLYELYDALNNVRYHYEYDLKGNLLKEVATNGNDMSYSYDNLGNVQKISYNIDNLVRSVDYEHEYEANEYTKEGYFNRLSNTFGDELILGESSQNGAEIFSSNFDTILDEELNMEVVRFYNYNSNIMYKLNDIKKYKANHDEWKRKFYYNKTFYAWVKPKPYISNQQYYKTNLFSFSKITETSAGAIKTNDVLSYLAISDSGNLIYYTTNQSPTIVSAGKIELNKWNLVGIQFTKPSGQTMSQAKIILNGTVTNVVNINENVGDINFLTLANQNNISELAAHLHTTLYFAMTSIGSYSYSNLDFLTIYNEGVKYLISNDITKMSGVSYYDEYTYDGFDVITLNGSLESSKGYKPCKVSKIDASYRFEKNRIFKYDTDSKRFVYGSLINTTSLKKGNVSALAYKIPLKNEGTISLRFKFTPSNSEKCILSAVNGLSEKIGIYITSANSLRIVINGSSLNGNLGFTPETWNTLIIRYKNSKLQAYCNATTLCNFTNTIDLTNCTIYLGNNSSFNKQLNGYLEMFAYSSTFITDTVKTKLLNNGSMTSVRNKMDSLGRLTDNTITVNNTVSVTSYAYDKTRVLSQTLPNGETISYSYNDVGQVVSKTFGTGNNPPNVTYTYDNFGRLIKEVYEDEKVHEYTYDRSGNITYDRTYVNNDKTEELQYRYSNGKLTMIANNTTGAILQEITYGSSNVGFYPDKLVLNGVMKNLTWNGKRLAGIGSEIKYTYNSQGIRIKKQTPTETTDFTLEGNNIISMKKVVSGETFRLDFVYDNNNQVVGLNTIEGQYFYIKDITGNILGLIDSNGSFVVKYKYDAWGKLLLKETINSCIAAIHNPFVYKGYYLDLETNFYYLNARYYAPEWKRFLSPDNYEYLEPTNINGLSMYTYCQNNPVMYYDPTGHVYWMILLLGGLIITGLIITEPTEDVARIDKNSEVLFGNLTASGPEINHKEITLISIEGSLAEERFYYKDKEEIYFYMSSFSGDLGLTYNKNENKIKFGSGFSFFSFGINIGRFHLSLNFGFCDLIQWGI